MAESQSASRRSFVNNIKYDNDGDVCARDGGGGGSRQQRGTARNAGLLEAI